MAKKKKKKGGNVCNWNVIIACVAGAWEGDTCLPRKPPFSLVPRYFQAPATQANVITGSQSVITWPLNRGQNDRKTLIGTAKIT